MEGCDLNDKRIKDFSYELQVIRYKKTQKGSSVSSGIKINEQKMYFTKEIETTRKNQTAPISVAQWVGHCPAKQKVAGP